MEGVMLIYLKIYVTDLRMNKMSITLNQSIDFDSLVFSQTLEL